MEKITHKLWLFVFALPLLSCSSPEKQADVDTDSVDVWITSADRKYLISAAPPFFIEQS